MSYFNHPAGPGRILKELLQSSRGAGPNNKGALSIIPRARSNKKGALSIIPRARSNNIGALSIIPRGRVE